MYQCTLSSSKSLAIKGLLISFSTALLLSGFLFRSRIPQPYAKRDPPPQHHLNAHDPLFEHLFPVQFPEQDVAWQQGNARTLRELMTCLVGNTCRENQTNVVLLASSRFAPQIQRHDSVEGAWALSVQNAFQQLGYTSLWFPNLSSASTYYRLFPDLVKLILADGPDIGSCFDSTSCIKSSSNPVGFPAWKLFSFSPQGTPAGPLGAEWVLTPEDYGTGARVLGYSIEDACRARRLVPHAEREPHVYILGDRLSYWYHRDYAWTDEAFWGLRDAFFLEVTLVGGLVNDTQWETYWPPYMDNYGLMAAEDYYSLVGHSQVLVGTGVPPRSAAPYEALCMGVPFVNPILRWDEKRPFHREAWVTQHDGLKFLEPPFVYHVKKHDVDGLIKAVRTARGAPIGRYVAPHMHQSALRTRVAELATTDWRARAQEILSRRVAAFEGPLFEL